MLYTGARERKTEAERGRHGEKTKERHGGGWVLEKKKGTAMRNREKELKKKPQRLRQWSRGSREMERQTERRKPPSSH